MLKDFLVRIGGLAVVALLVFFVFPNGAEARLLLGSWYQNPYGDIGTVYRGVVNSNDYLYQQPVYEQPPVYGHGKHSRSYGRGDHGFWDDEGSGYYDDDYDGYHGKSAGYGRRYGRRGGHGGQAGYYEPQPQAAPLVHTFIGNRVQQVSGYNYGYAYNKPYHY